MSWELKVCRAYTVASVNTQSERTVMHKTQVMNGTQNQFSTNVLGGIHPPHIWQTELCNFLQY